MTFSRSRKLDEATLTTLVNELVPLVAPDHRRHAKQYFEEMLQSYNGYENRVVDLLKHAATRDKFYAACIELSAERPALIDTYYEFHGSRDARTAAVERFWDKLYKRFT